MNTPKKEQPWYACINLSRGIGLLMSKSTRKLYRSKFDNEFRVVTIHVLPQQQFSSKREKIIQQMSLSGGLMRFITHYFSNSFRLYCEISGYWCISTHKMSLQRSACLLLSKSQCPTGAITYVLRCMIQVLKESGRLKNAYLYIIDTFVDICFDFWNQEIARANESTLQMHH